MAGHGMRSGLEIGVMLLDFEGAWHGAHGVSGSWRHSPLV